MKRFILPIEEERAKMVVPRVQRDIFGGIAQKYALETK